MSVLLAGGPLHAQQVIDQSQPLGLNVGVAGPIWIAQSFTTSANNISGAGFLNQIGYNPFARTVVTGSIEFRLYTAPVYLGGTLLHTTVSSYSVPDGQAWIDAFWEPVSIVPGQFTLYAHVTPGSGDINLVGTTPGPYAGGAGGSWTSESALRLDQRIDFAFRTYTTTVPEPGTYALMAVELVGMALAKRRRVGR